MSEQYLARPGVNSKGPNEHWTDAEGVVHIKLTLGKEALVDAADYRKVAPYRWHAAKQKIKHGELFYAITSIKGEDGKDKTLRMHVLLRDPPDGFVVDHIFGDGLDNRSAKTRTGHLSRPYFTMVQKGSQRNERKSTSRADGNSCKR